MLVHVKLAAIMLECDCKSFAMPLLKCSEWFYHVMLLCSC